MARAPAGRETVASEVLSDLVARGARGEREAQQALLVRYGPFIRSAVRARLGRGLRGRESTSDLEQQVALEVLRSLPRHEWQGQGAFIAWLRRIATAEVIDAARYHAAARRDPAREAPADERLVAGGAGVETFLDEARRLEKLDALLDELTPQQAQAVVLFYRGHSHSEIGEVLGCSEEAARKHVARGRARLTSLASR
jgi:RNA polymerase sigma factor (sigma-70 family)